MIIAIIKQSKEYAKAKKRAQEYKATLSKRDFNIYGMNEVNKAKRGLK